MPDESRTSDGEDRSFDPLADPEEQRVFYVALDSFRQYRRAAHYNVTHLRRQSFYSLPSAQVELLSSPPFNLPRTFQAVDDAIDCNADIAEAIIAEASIPFGVDLENERWVAKATPSDLDKARSTIRQLYRDWSVEGFPERNASYSIIFSALQKHLQTPMIADRQAKQVLVPGAGLGRLVFELCAAGYCVEGNEISYHQLLTSNYMLNFVSKAGQHTLYPWALSFSNHLKRGDQLKAVKIPDVHPGTSLEAAEQHVPGGKHYSERMSMTSGDFCVLYRQGEYIGAFDAVVTCFFVDTAPNVINYIETVKSCLKPSGLWINVGPLLWHFESTPTPAEREKHDPGTDLDKGESIQQDGKNGIGEPGSFELTNEELLALLLQYGFNILEQGQAPATGYTQNPASMLQNVYRPVFWVAQKPLS